MPLDVADPGLPGGASAPALPMPGTMLGLPLACSSPGAGPRGFPGPPRRRG
ncbi:hypothetical protein AvCA_07430 [Azotobacter vinelandii CA]|uniref:Uncharacterized protein n=2 Tax=Azotobacter vinelandii TaxID=354 RepID=C1DLP1_AZOVD|nr:hypothetical protein Avin_07430 [Azotobacter vinelandii DJ]AGK15526.1 hypothetical protein AvCA_07430 [Azotobacter vinelandii CA]AGK19492.1 hypothetical protein AvCA6_07430 [Azotobacter vinelandii CA6]